MFLSLKIDFVLPNREDPNEMLHSAAFQLGLNCLQTTSLGVSSLQRVDVSLLNVCKMGSKYLI